MFKIGDLVFFKTGRKGTARTAAELKFNGHGFGVILGVVPPFEKEPPTGHLLRLMGSIGFVSFDDIGELLGPETGKLCVALFERKYYGRGPNGDQPAPPPALAVDEKPSRSLTEVKAVDPEAPPCGS